MEEMAKKWEPKIPNYTKQKSVDVEKKGEEYRKRLLEGSEEYQAGMAAMKFMKEIKAKNAGEKYTAEMNVQKQMREGLEQKSFKDLYVAFSSDIAIIRKMVAEYNNLKEARLMEIKGEEILAESEKIKSEILHQIEAADMPEEKSDFDNLRIELEKITRNVRGISDLKVAN